MSLPQYLPTQQEKTAALQELFRNVDKLISDFVADDNNKLTEDKVRHYVCGNVFIDRLDEFHDKIKLLKPQPIRGYDVLMAKLCAENNEKPDQQQLKFGEVSKLASRQYHSLSKEAKDQLDSAANAANGAEIPSLQAREKQFAFDMNKMKANLEYLMTNYNTHAFLVTYTDTLHEELFAPALLTNSSMTKKCVNFVNKSLQTFSVLSCFRRMVLENSSVRHTSAPSSAAVKTTRKRKQIHFPVLPPALPDNIPLPPLDEQTTTENDVEGVVVEAVDVLIIDDDNANDADAHHVDAENDEDDDEDDDDDKDNDEDDDEADSEGIFSSGSDDDEDDKNDRNYGSADDDEDDEEDKDVGYQDNGVSRVPDCAPSFQILPIPPKLRGPSAHSATPASLAAMASSSTVDGAPATKRSKTDLKRILQAEVCKAFNKASRKPYKSVPWLSLFDETKMQVLGMKLVGWDTNVFPPPICEGKTSFDVYNGTNAMETLIQNFEDETIYFEQLVDSDSDEY